MSCCWWPGADPSGRLAGPTCPLWTMCSHGPDSPSLAALLPSSGAMRWAPAPASPGWLGGVFTRPAHAACVSLHPVCCSCLWRPRTCRASSLAGVPGPSPGLGVRPANLCGSRGADVEVLKVERIQLINAILNLCTYHHPENIQLPPG